MGGLLISINEVFPNPTVKEVLFQITFPNLFSIENRIGEFQERILKEFPDSSLIRRRTFTFVDAGPNAELEKIQKGMVEEPGNRIWQFKSPKNFKLDVLTNSLDMVSEYHKTYSLEGGEKFRDIIAFVLENFFAVFSIPILKRIGLRYIDLCPIPSRDKNEFTSYYNSSFPLNKFEFKNAKTMYFTTTVERNGYFLNYRETLKIDGESDKLILDFDGFAEDVPSEKYLSITDKLHEIINDEYEKTIKKPVYKYMRKKKEEKNE